MKCPPGDVLLSRLPAEQVPSALEGLTAVFGMGTGVSPPPSSPDKNLSILCSQSFDQEIDFGNKFGGAERDRTDDLLLARQALSQLSYSPIRVWKVVLG